jgi:hypothetical protein
MSESGINAELLSDPAPSPLVDADEPAAAKPKADGRNAAAEANPATDADEQKTDTPDATDENADKKPSRRQRKLQMEREARSAAEAERDRLRAELEQVRAKSAPTEPRLEDYESEAQWLRACQKFDAQQASQARPVESVDASRQRIAQDWTEREKDFVAEVPTYEKDVMGFVNTEIGYFSQAAREKIVELGPEVLHYLATNPDVADDIIELSPRRQVAALAKLDVSKATGLTDGDAGDEDEGEAAVITQRAPKPASRPEPPAPARHTRQGSTAPAGLSDDMDAYIQQRRKQGAVWAR